MTSQADFSEWEWNTILQAPGFAVTFIIQAELCSPPVAHQRLLLGISAILKNAWPETSSALVGAVREAFIGGQRPHFPSTFPEDLAEARQITLRGCRQAAALLAQRVPHTEADAFSAWLMAICEIVAAVPIEPASQAHSAETQTALDQLAATLELTDVFV
ncbi:MAG: hypothetical protein HGA45_22790 [Chloroflexales bacterium]|nr:hypothetical protein [Chloroflexales bacterium]